ncbi:MAG TPA: sulfotransferase [Vicinamibacterales bacterium]|nr:sulfotransferase [Vicinamibacterales bacterium]
MNDPPAIAPVSWVRHAPWSKWLTQVLRTRQPAALVLSLPRSGSSWVGESLGCATDALYLREPVTQSDHLFHELGTVFAIDRPDLDARYERSASKAYAGWPDFDPGIVRFPASWALTRRRSRRVVIKEVNPLACGWHIERYAPRIVLLVRHPAAVALSWQRKGWLTPDEQSWATNGELQGRALRAALEALAPYEAQRVVVYEDLCADPIGSFTSLYAFAGLTWEGRAHRFISERMHRTDEGNTWNTSRNSQEMIHSWRRHVVPAHVRALREAFGEFNLPWYRKDRDWESDSGSPRTIGSRRTERRDDVRRTG